MSGGGGPRRAGLAIGLSALAGYVDAVGYLQLGGTFVSFMSGNTTISGIGLAGHAGADFRLAGSLVGLFVGGVVVAHLLRRVAVGRPQFAVLALLSLLLLGACLLQHSGAPTMAMYIVALAMGAQNAVFERDGGVAIPLTYMTGTLVKVGDHIADALSGGPRWLWVAPALRWAGLLGGAVAGAAVFASMGAAALWVALAAMATVTMFAAVQPDEI